MAEAIALTLQPVNPASDFSFSAYELHEMAPIDLKTFVVNPTNHSLRITSESVMGGDLPAGLVCSPEGVLSGIPARGTASEIPNDILVFVECEGALPLTFDIYLTIYPAENLSVILPENEATAMFKADAERMKEEYGIDLGQLENFWGLFSDDLSHPDLKEFLTRKIKPADIYYLLGRFATLTIWNADDVSPADEGQMIQLKEASPHFFVYDFKVALIATPKDLYEASRTLEDALQTARAMVLEVQRRKWNVQLAGYDKMVTAAWVEANRLNDLKQGHAIKVEYYSPTPTDQHILQYSLGKQTAKRGTAE